MHVVIIFVFDMSQVGSHAGVQERLWIVGLGFANRVKLVERWFNGLILLQCNTVFAEVIANT